MKAGPAAPSARRGGPAWQRALLAGSRPQALIRAGRSCGCAGCGGPACCRWPQVAEQGPGVPGAVGIGQEPDLGVQAAVVHLGCLPAAGVVDEVVQVAGLQAESGRPGGQLFRLAQLAAVNGWAGAGQPAGAGQEDGLGFQAREAAWGAVQLRVLGDDVRPQAGDGLGPGYRAG